MANRARTLVFSVLAVFAVVGLILALLAVWSRPKPGGYYAGVNGIRMYYEVYGRGRPLILLHGGTGNGKQFAHQIPAFEKRFQLIVPDLRAQGRTADGPGPLGYHLMAEDIVALMDHLRVKRADVMGWSDGGIVGLDLAIHHPERVRRLVTFGANFTPDGLNAADVLWNATATASSFGPGTRQAYEELAPDPSHYEAAMEKILRMWRTEPHFTLEQLGSIRARTLICAGENDVVRREHTEALARAIPRSRLWIVPGATHSVILEQPELVNKKVMRFLRD
jgi:pimeloyl-ACP methyl ester carboxylesterase